MNMTRSFQIKKFIQMSFLRIQPKEVPVVKESHYSKIFRRCLYSQAWQGY